MRNIQIQLLPLCCVIVLAGAGGWAGASGFFVWIMNRVTDGTVEWKDRVSFHFFPPLSWAPADIYPLLALFVFLVCTAVVWLMRHRTMRPKASK